MKSGLVAALLLVACTGDNYVAVDASVPVDSSVSGDGTVPVDGSDLVDSSVPVDGSVADAPIDTAVIDAPGCYATCPSPTPGKASLCGLILDAEDPVTIQLPGADGDACDPAQPTAIGPCSLRLRVYDALEYAADPVGATPLVSGTQTITNCGHYFVQDLTVPASGSVVVVVDDHPAVTSTRVPTVSPGGAQPGLMSHATVYTTRLTSEQAWSTSAALSPGFAERGALLFRFRGANSPPGVQVLRNGREIPDDDFYFSDESLRRLTVDSARTTTGPNGSTLVIGDGSVAIYDGDEEAGCWAPRKLASTLPGHIYVGEFRQVFCP
jgi:hypothetical protein